jgi:signal transduction histidine kinase
MFGKFLDGINFVARCKKYGLGLWQCPNFLFLVMGVITIFAMFSTYFASEIFASDSVTILSVTTVAIFIMTLGTFVIQGVEKVAEANILKTEFISIISHQLCTPLSAIKWNMEVIETEKDSSHCLPEKQTVFLENIKKSNDQMLKMVTDLLEVARIDQGRAIFQNNTIDLTGLIEKSIAGFRKMAAGKNIEIKFDSKIENINVCVDEKKMRIVLDNLIGNAVKYSKDGGNIEIKLAEKNGKIVFSVQDWGVGIPKQQHSRVFEKFFRSRNESRYRTDGVGIGLYLAKSILKHCGGEVWFESESGRGSTFFFSLPAANA